MSRKQKLSLQELEKLQSDMELLKAENEALEAEKLAALAQLSAFQATEAKSNYGVSNSE